jgi:hypothetical protein
MKEFSEYASAEDLIRDFIKEGYFSRNKKLVALYPSLVARPPRKNHIGPPKIGQVERMRVAILEAITNKTFDVTMSLSKLSREVRSDNHPEEFKIAIRRLIEERKIVESVMQTGKRGRPFIYYNLFEF